MDFEKSALWYCYSGSGATVLVPLLIDIDPAVALFTAGVGTLIFHFITKGKVPVFLGSSFAFIAPIIAATKLYGYAGTLGGIIAVGFVYGIVSAIIKLWGLKVIEKIFPSVVVGPVIMIIGLSLASVGVDMAKTDWLIALSVLTTAILIVIFAKGLFKLIPIFIAIIVGYIISIFAGLVDFSSGVGWISIDLKSFFSFYEFLLLLVNKN